MCEQCTRREFIGTASAGWAGMDASSLGAEAEATTSVPLPVSKVRICVMIAGAPANQSWGTPEATIETAKKHLAEAEQDVGNVEFVIGQRPTPRRLLGCWKRPDRTLLCWRSARVFGPSRIMPVIFQQRRPVALFHLPVIGGHDWCLVPRWLEEGHRITLFNSSDFGDLRVRRGCCE